MNKLLLTITPVIALAASVIALNPAQAYATTGHAECAVASIGKYNSAGEDNSRFVLNGTSTVSATFEVTGDDTCKLDVVLASWQAPDADKGLPYDQQKLYKHVTGTFGKGKHTLTVELPQCYYQVDLARGKNPTGPNGSAVYETGRLMGSLHGGTKSCEAPTTPPTTTTTSPVVPKPQAAEVMPSTGVGSVAGIFAGTSAFGAIAHRFISKRRG